MEARAGPARLRALPSSPPSPEIVNPIYVNWDHRGRAFVIETIDYPNNLQQFNLGHDRITICEDTDGDGRADKFTRFAEKLSIPTSLVFANGGVICTNGTEILFLKDTNGDDKADVQEILFSGFNMGDTHAGPSNLKWGPDGWIYATIGYSGFSGKVGTENHRFSSGLFRFLPGGSKLEYLQPTTNNTWGTRVHRGVRPPRLHRQWQPELLPYLSPKKSTKPPPSNNHAPRAPTATPSSTPSPPTSARSISSTATPPPPDTRFIPRAVFRDPTTTAPPSSAPPPPSSSGHFDLTQKGASWIATQSPNNLYASADGWSAPVCAETGPDGAVWICDWYNIIVQHNPTPSLKSAGIKARTGKGNAYVTPLRDRKHGRIYRLYPKDSPDDPYPNLDPDDPESLLAGLSHPNLFWRLHAQRLIEEKGDPLSAPGLEHLMKTSSPAVPHALHALHSLEKLRPEFLSRLLKEGHPAARRAAIHLATPDQLKAAFIADAKILATGRDLAEILIGFSHAASDPEIGTAIYNTAAISTETIFNDPALRDAWKIAARRHAPSVIAAGQGKTTTPQTPPATNLLPNPGFSTTADGKPSGWTDLRIYSGAGADQIQVTSSPHGRSGKCLKITANDFTDCGVGISLSLKKGTRYRLSGWIKTENLETKNKAPGAMLNIHGGKRTRGLTGTKEWTQVSVEFDSANRSQALVHCLFSGYGLGRGTVYFDDVSLTPIGSTDNLAGLLSDLQAFVKKGKEPAPKKSRTHKPDPKVHDRGRKVFSVTCIACHGSDGKGVPGVFPPLDGTEWVTGDPERLTKIVLHGLTGEIEVKGHSYNNVMAPLATTLDDQQISDVLTFVRQSWSNDAAPVIPDFVKKTRLRTASQKGMLQAKDLK